MELNSTKLQFITQLATDERLNYYTFDYAALASAVFLCLWSLEVVITSYCFKGTDHKYNDREITYLFDFMFFVDHLNLINPRLRYNYNNS